MEGFGKIKWKKTLLLLQKKVKGNTNFSLKNCHQISRHTFRQQSTFVHYVNLLFSLCSFTEKWDLRIDKLLSSRWLFSYIPLFLTYYQILLFTTFFLAPTQENEEQKQQKETRQGKGSEKKSHHVLNIPRKCD